MTCLVIQRETEPLDDRCFDVVLDPLKVVFFGAIGVTLSPNGIADDF